jgi:hypothetical protein
MLLAQPRQCVREIECPYLHAHFGMPLAEAVQERREEAAGRRAERADHQCARLAASEGPRTRERFVGCGQHLARALQQRLAGGRELDTTGAA